MKTNVISDEYVCRICGEYAVEDITNKSSDVPSGSYCATHALKFGPLYFREQMA
jgi:hypothetical protein